MKSFAAFLFLFVTGCYMDAQNPVNAFAGVTAISGNSVLTVASVNETYHTFEDGDFVIIMQMQDDVIGTNYKLLLGIRYLPRYN